MPATQICHTTNVELSAGTMQNSPREASGFRLSMVAPDEAEKNIAHYRSRLQMGAERETRTTLLGLLLAEEKMLGRTREQLTRIDRHIEKLERIIAQQEKRVGRVKFIGIGSERATLLLSTLNDLMATYQRHRQWITAEVADSDGT